MKDLVHDKAESKEHGDDGRKAPGMWNRLKERTSRALALTATVVTLSTGACGNEFGAQIPPVGNDGGVQDGGMGGDGGMHDGGMGGDGGMQDGGMGGDGGMDGGMGGDGGMDAGPTACATVMVAAPWTGLIANGADQIHGGYTFTYRGPNGGGDALFDIGCEGMLRFDDHAFPEDIVTSLAVPIDGRTIKVTPHSVNGAQTNVTLEIQ